MHTLLAQKSVTRVLVYADYEIITCESLEDISERYRPLWRFFGGQIPDGLSFVAFLAFFDEYHNSFDYNATKGDPISLVLPTADAVTQLLEGKPGKSYDPMTITGMHTHFSKIKDNASLLQFCRKFGIPFGLSPSLRSHFGKFLTSEDILIQLQPANVIFNESKHIFDLMKLWKAVCEKDEKYIRTNWWEYEQIYKANINNANSTDLWFDRAIIVLNALLKNEFDGQTITRRINKQVHSFIGFRDLRCYLYYLVKRSIAIEHLYRECPHCHALFEVDHMKRQYCPPISGHGRSSCENAFNQMQHRKNKAREDADG